MKRVLIIVLSLSLFLNASFVLAEVSSFETLTSGDYKYTILNDGTAKIINCYRYIDETELIIPSKLDGYTVSTIGESAFYSCKNLTSVIIPDSVTHIDSTAFAYCSHLVSVSLPDSIQEIGDNPFVDCYNLSSIQVTPDNPYLATIDGVLFSKTDKRLITYPCGFLNTSYVIPDGITVLGSLAFVSCSNLTSINIPDSVLYIESQAFYDCDSLVNVALPQNLLRIGDLAFARCKCMNKILLPDSIIEIGTNPFSDCDKLSNIIVSPDHQYLASANGALLCKPDKRLVSYPPATNSSVYVIPEGVKNIDDQAFFRIKNLSSIIIPNSVLSIGDNAFSYCKSLTDLNIPDSVISIGKDAFLGCSNLISIIVGHSSYARQYCIDNTLPYTYPDANDWLKDN